MSEQGVITTILLAFSVALICIGENAGWRAHWFGAGVLAATAIRIAIAGLK